ncbi:MAG: GlxA family transcriptional regulator [Rhizomicrobium sp.]
MARVAVLDLEGTQLSSLAIFLDMFDLANRYSTRSYEAREDLAPPFAVKLLSEKGRPLPLMGGRNLPVDESIQNGEHYDLVIIPAFEVGRDLDIGARLAAMSGVCRWLNQQRAAGAAMAASCSGVSVLAEAGLLSNVTVTIPWWLEKPFRRRYADVDVDSAQIISQADGIFCAGSTRAEAALAHRLVEYIASPNVANWLAKITLVEPYPDGPQPWNVFSPQMLRHDALVAQAQHWLQLRFAQKPRLRDLADLLAVSERTLVRRFEQSLGMTPLDYLQTLRIEAAKQMLARSVRHIDRIGYLVGYSDPGFFKKMFRSRAGMSPSEYRRKNADPGDHPPGDAADQKASARAKGS